MCTVFNDILLRYRLIWTYYMSHESLIYQLSNSNIYNRRNLSQFSYICPSSYFVI